jgi:hypothetical protein
VGCEIERLRESLEPSGLVSCEFLKEKREG